MFSIFTYYINTSFIKIEMPKRRTFLGLARIFATGFVGFTLIDWLEAQALKSRSNNNSYKNKINESVSDVQETPLHLAIKNQDKDLAKELITKGKNIKATNSEGATPLHYAASFGDEKVINLLINKGADIKAKDNNNKTPADWAIQAKRTDNLKILNSLSPNDNFN